MTRSKALVKAGMIQQQILWIRCEKVTLDNDFAEVYSVTTKVLNEVVRQNSGRFPSDFMFCLSKRKKQKVVTICEYLKHREA